MLAVMPQHQRVAVVRVQQDEGEVMDICQQYVLEMGVAWGDIRMLCAAMIEQRVWIVERDQLGPDGTVG
jgi:hypothetical protein